MNLLLTCDAVGGIWQYSLDLARGLKAHGVDTLLAVTGPPASREQRAAAEQVCSQVIDTGVPLDWLAETAKEVRAAGEALAHLAGEARADLVQLHAPALAAGVRFPVPTVAAIHSDVGTWWASVRGGGLPQDFAWRADLVREGLRTADLTIAPSRAFADAVHAAYGTRPHPVHNGRTAAALPPAPRSDTAFTAGRLWDAAKDVATFDAAAALATAPFPAAGPLTGPNGECVELGHAQALGNLPEPALAAQLAARPVFVSNAVYEPFGLAVLEAAQAGCALVLADTPTSRELWDGAALFVPPRDPAALARAVSFLLNVPLHPDVPLRRQGPRAHAPHEGELAGLEPRSSDASLGFEDVPWAPAFAGVRGPDLRARLGDAARARAALYTPEAAAAAMATHYAGLVRPKLEAAA